jgi:Lipase (class 3)
MSTTYASSSLSSKDKGTCTPNPHPPQPLKALPAGFDSQLAYLLGLCCNSANDQYAAYVPTEAADPNKDANDPTNWGIISVNPKPWDPDFSQIVAQGYKANPTHLNLSVYEIDENGKSVEIPAGFIVRLDPTDANKSSTIVVAFHGTQNNFEMNKIDNDLDPANFDGGNLGSVHGGFYKQYTTGSNGQGDLSDRADGSLAQQINDYFKDNGNATLPVKVTGHSLGGALATLCALDIAYNCASKFKSISMYSLASPRVADESTDQDHRGDAAKFVSNYQQYVPDSYRIVNTEDGVPKVPPALLVYACAHVLGDTDALNLKIVKSSPLDQNVVSFTDENPKTRNGDDSPQECQGAHSCPAVYVPFLEGLAQHPSS